MWAVLLVTALHLLSTSGTWWITDHGEILAVADRFLTTGQFDLKDLGPGWAEWTRIAAARGSFTTRFLPLSILVLVPFLALDHLFGWRDPAAFNFVYFQGHVFVGMGLGLAGRFAARASRSAAAGALCVLLLGLNWPVWMIARRMGPEPVLFALLAVFGTGGTRWRALALVLLPWVHATGPLLGLCALLWLWTSEGTTAGASMRILLGAWTLGAGSVALFWNLPVHGNAFLGGYGRFATDSPFEIGNPVHGVATVLGPMLAWTLPLGLLTIRSGKIARFQTLALWLPAISFFGIFSHPALLPNPEPERRFAPILVLWAIACLPPLSRLRPKFGAGLALVSLASGVIGLSSDFVDTVATPLGVFSGPLLMFVRLAFVKGHPGLAAAWVLLLGSAIVITGSRTLDPILNAPGAQLDQTGSVAQNRNP
jgi:hypothetical protein